MLVTGDLTPTRIVAKKGIAKRKKAIEDPRAKSLNQKTTVSNATRARVLLVMTATLSPAGRSAKAVAGKVTPSSVPKTYTLDLESFLRGLICRPVGEFGPADWSW